MAKSVHAFRVDKYLGNYNTRLVASNSRRKNKNVRCTAGREKVDEGEAA